MVDPYLSGKISLLETLQLTCGAIHGQGTVKDGNTVDGAAPEARASAHEHQNFNRKRRKLGERWAFLASSQVD